MMKPQNPYIPQVHLHMSFPCLTIRILRVVANIFESVRKKA